MNTTNITDSSHKHETSARQMMFSKRYLIKLVIPLMIDQALALSVGLLDTIMVASAGESAVSGVSLVESINTLIINLFAALATGGAIVAGQYLGKGDNENGNRAAKHLVMTTTSLSLIIMTACLVLNGPMLSILFGRIEPGVMKSARAYFYITALSFPFIAMFSSAAAIFRGMGNTKLAMINALIMNVVNVVGNSVFIYVFQLGAFGAGLATLIARMTAAVSMMYMLRNPRLTISVRSYSPKGTDRQMIKRILKIGIPSGLENSFFQTGKLILTGLVATMGTTAIAANAVGFSIIIVAIVPGSAIGLAITSVVAQCAGAKEYDQADYYIKYLMKIAYIFMFIFNIVILVLSKHILRLYQLSPETFDLALKIVVIHGIGSMLIWPLSFTLPHAFRAAGDVRFPMTISITSMCVCRIMFSYIFAYSFGFGVLSIWLAMGVDWTFRSVCFVSRWISGKWKNIEVI